MEKKGILKACVIAIAAVFLAGNVIAQTSISQVVVTNALSVPLDAAGNIIPANNIAPTGALPEVASVLVDNFEYFWRNYDYY